jgi:hypothetical protein
VPADACWCPLAQAPLGSSPFRTNVSPSSELPRSSFPPLIRVFLPHDRPRHALFAPIAHRTLQNYLRFHLRRLSPCRPMISTMSSSPSLAVTKMQTSKKVKRECPSITAACAIAFHRSTSLPPSLHHSPASPPRAGPSVQHEADPTQLVARGFIAQLARIRRHGRVRLRPRRRRSRTDG